MTPAAAMAATIFPLNAFLAAAIAAVSLLVNEQADRRSGKPIPLSAVKASQRSRLLNQT
jgi:hypothetical protein